MQSAEGWFKLCFLWAAVRCMMVFVGWIVIVCYTWGCIFLWERHSSGLFNIYQFFCGETSRWRIFFIVEKKKRRLESFWANHKMSWEDQWDTQWWGCPWIRQCSSVNNKNVFFSYCSFCVLSVVSSFTAMVSRLEMIAKQRGFELFLHGRIALR